jgi:pimeloyl-ACP methyl ester carboxylesterase
MTPTVLNAAIALALVLTLAPLAAAQTKGELPPLPELKFAEIPAASQERYTGDRFSYMEAGKADGFPILLLHGVGANSMHWRFQFAGLGDTWRLIAWNAPGYMLSDNLKKDTPDCRDYADALRDFVDALGLQRFHILGNSFGSRVGQCFAAYHGARVVKMAFTGTTIGQQSLTPEQREKILAAREAQVAKGGWEFGARVAALLGSKAPPEIVPLVQTTLRATNPRGFMQAIRAGFDYYSPDLADRFTMPVLLIQGSEDRVTPPEKNAGILIKALPNGRLELLEGYGHLPEVETPERVNALVRAFFAS